MFEEIEKIIKNFVDESKQVKKQISEIENQRTELAQERNSKKNANINKYKAEIDELGKQISELGNQSQELQNKLNNKFYEVKNIISLAIDNLMSEEIRKLRKIAEERQELEEKNALQIERKIKYEMQKQEFYQRFGRMPELSENAKQEYEIQDKEYAKCKIKLDEIQKTMNDIELKISELMNTKKNFQKGNWSNVSVEDNNKISKEKIVIPEFIVEELEPIEEITIQEFEQMEEFKVEEIEVEDFGPIEKIEVEEFKPTEELDIEKLFKELFEEDTNIKEIKEESKIENVQKIEEEKKETDKIEELAKVIVEQIVEEQTRDLEINKIETENEIIKFEKQEEKKETRIKTKPKLLNIIAKIEEGKVVYKAQINNGEEIKIYPTKLTSGNALLNYKQKRKEISEMLAEYVFLENKIFDKKVINKIDSIICEILNEFAKKYDYDVRELIFNYAMSFSKYINSLDEIVPITYNFSYLNTTNLRNTEKRTIAKICKNANSNIYIDVIGNINKISKIKYIFKRLFMANSIDKLPEGKY